MSRIVFIATLIIAGEIVFGLPFHTARFFRPTLLDVFGFTNTELGDLFAVYGVAAMLCYFPGGALADRFTARALMSISLVATGLGGFYMATIPGSVGMAVLYGYWGVTSVFLFWGALIRATRNWGGPSSQGMAFGILDGGRGLVAFAVAGLVVVMFAGLMPDDATIATDAERRAAFRAVILAYSVATLAAAALVWLNIPVMDAGETHTSPLQGMRTVLGRPIVWAQAAVIVCAYCGFKGLDYYADYAVRVLGMNEVDGARFATWGALIRPFAAVAAGLLADRFEIKRMTGIMFGLTFASFGMLSVLEPDAGVTFAIYINVAVSFAAVFALRGIYFALLEDSRTPKYLTGAAVGMVSLLGYTPEIFFAPIAGRIIDANPGLVGYQNFFLFLAAIGAAGVAVVAILVRMHRPGHRLWPETES